MRIRGAIGNVSFVLEDSRAVSITPSAVTMKRPPPAECTRPATSLMR
ncbi:MAG: hypothetical protein WCZ20_11245 [Hydrogenophaga sp.]